jgi:hypothetical protein
MTDRAEYRVLDAKKHDKIFLPCPGSCRSKTWHEVLAHVQWTDEDPGVDESCEDCLIVACAGCNAVSFCKQASNTRDFEHDPQTGEEVRAVTESVYPPRLAGTGKMEREYLLPDQVRTIYNETHTALCVPQPILAGIGIRAIVETVCKEKAAPGNRLEEQIDGLASLNLITADGATILHSLRLLGNRAAHEVKPHTPWELGIALGVVEHLLQTVYIMPLLAKKLPQPSPPRPPS